MSTAAYILIIFPCSSELSTMRLLNTKTGELNDFGSLPPEYAILSHVWGTDEQTYQDIASLQVSVLMSIYGCSQRRSF